MIIIITPKRENLPEFTTDKKLYGKALFDSLDIKQEIDQKISNQTLPIVIKSTDPIVLNIPWELIYSDSYGFLAQNSRFSLSYNILSTDSQDDLPPLDDLPLRVLFFSSLPDDLAEEDRLQTEQEQSSVIQELMPYIKDGYIKLKIPRDGRIESFKKLLDDFRPHLVFLSGHGGYSDDKGFFLFEDKRGLKSAIPQKELSDCFVNLGVKCVVVSACESAKASGDMLESGLSRSLALDGIDYVIGMRESIRDKAGVEFAKVFIERVAKKEKIAIAVQKAREAIYRLTDNASNHWHLPILIARDTSRGIVDWDSTPKPTTDEVTKKVFNNLYRAEHFSGRRKEFREFYNYFYDNRLKNLLLYGEGGIGKSATVAEFGLILREEKYRVFDFSYKESDNDFEDFLLTLLEELSSENLQSYLQIRELYKNEKQNAKGILKYILKTNPKIAFIFDNLETVQDDSSGEIEDEKIKTWIEAIGENENVVLLMTSRWNIPHCKNSMQLKEPLYMDFLYHISQQSIQLPIREKRYAQILQKIYDTLGGNYRGVEFFVSAAAKMNIEEIEQFLIQLLEEATRDIQIDMAIDKIISYRSKEEKELLYRLPVYQYPMTLGGI